MPPYSFKARQEHGRPSLAVERFGTLPHSKDITLYTLSNATGIEVQTINYGGIILSIRTPDRKGRLEDITLGFDALEAYLNNRGYLGAIIGRYCNRIAGGAFTLDGKEYALARNAAPNHLHGGWQGFDKVVWKTSPFVTSDQAGVVFSHVSADGEEGYPGTLAVNVTYTLTGHDELVIDYHATTDQATPINLTQHTYFNLAGRGNGDILGHVLRINARRYLPITSALIPTGKLLPLANTPLDFRQPTPIGDRIEAQHPQLSYAGGYDHNYVLDKDPVALSKAARVWDPKSGRTLEVRTTEPGLQFYSGNKLKENYNGRAYRPQSGFCLEAQHFPDSPNHPHFPSTILRPGQTYHSRTIYAFATTSEL